MDIRGRWRSDLLSTIPADRGAVESCLREIYAAGGLAAPRVFWFDSPFRAAGAAALLIGASDEIWRRLVEAMGRVKVHREWFDRLRKDLCEVSGSPDWPAVTKAVGPSLSPAHAGAARGKSLQLPITLARMSLHEDVAASFTALNEGDPLFAAERSFRQVIGGQGQWSALNPMLSASFYQFVLYCMLAHDEEHLKGQPPAVLTALWTVARSAGPWWPFENAVIISDHPSEVHIDGEWRLHNGDGPAVVFADGEKAWAWEGRAMREEWIMHPEKIPAREFKRFEKSFRDYMSARAGGAVKAAAAPETSALLKKEMPANADDRLALLRAHNGGRLLLYDRYMAGEHEQVWSDLIGLGPALRADPNAADGLAVAYETMRRVSENVKIVTRRLERLGYRFTGEAHTPPDRKTRKHVARIEKTLGALPLSLRAFYETVGAVDWIGRHPSLAKPGDSVSPDPLVVFGPEDVIDAAQAEDEEGGGAVVIAPDDLHKANVSGGPPYEIAVPDMAADARLLNERHDLYFVDYLRLVFRFGGFPGYDGIDVDVPQEITALKEGLLSF